MINSFGGLLCDRAAGDIVTARRCLGDGAVFLDGGDRILACVIILVVLCTGGSVEDKVVVSCEE